MRRSRTRLVRFIVVALAAALLPLANKSSVGAVLNPVATNEATYQALGRVFSDPHGCLSVDLDDDEVNDLVAPNTSPWAKGNACVGQFIQYDEFVNGSKLLAGLYPRFMEVIRLDEAYDNPNFRSAGLPRIAAVEDGKLRVLGRDRRPIYMLKVTDTKSKIPESMRYHFVYAGSIHGIERAGAEGQIRAAEDLVTWAAKFPNKKIVETDSDQPAPTAAETLKKSVIYFVFPNPDGWNRGQLSPVDTHDQRDQPELHAERVLPAVQRQRDRREPRLADHRLLVPSVHAELRAGDEGDHVGARRDQAEDLAAGTARSPVRRRYRSARTARRERLLVHAHGCVPARLPQERLDRRYRNAHLRDQTARMEWSPYIGTIFEGADQWGSTIDSIGYTISGGMSDWFDSELGLGAVGNGNEMSLSHLAPNTVFDPTNEQMHIDGNKGLIYSQISSILTSDEKTFTPKGKIGYVFNPRRVQVAAKPRPKNPGLPAQNDIDTLIPCVVCDEPGVVRRPSYARLRARVRRQGQVERTLQRRHHRADDERERVRDLAGSCWRSSSCSVLNEDGVGPTAPVVRAGRTSGRLPARRARTSRSTTRSPGRGA